MTRDVRARAGSVDSMVYAESLYRYAAPRLDRSALRCWLIQRLMLDDGIDHRCAEDVVEHVLSKERMVASATGHHSIELS